MTETTTLLTRELAESIRNAFGPDSWIYETTTTDELLADFTKGAFTSVGEFVADLLFAEQTGLEPDDDCEPLTDEEIAENAEIIKTIEARLLALGITPQTQAEREQTWLG